MGESWRGPWEGNTVRCTNDRGRPRRLAILGSNNARALAPAQVDVETVDPEPVGARLRPVDVFPELSLVEQHLEIALLHADACLQSHVTVQHEPGVVVDGLAEAGESVVRHHDQRGMMLVRGFHGVADDRVHQLI